MLEENNNNIEEFFIDLNLPLDLLDNFEDDMFSLEMVEV